MSARVRVLALDAEPASAALLEGSLRRSFEVLVTRAEPEALAILEASGDIAVIIASDGESDFDAIQFLSTCAERFPHARRILISDSQRPELYRQAINLAQVQHLAMHPLDPSSLRPAVERLAGDFLEAQQERRLARMKRRQRSSSDRFWSSGKSSINSSPAIDCACPTHCP